ncbi:MAG: septum formation protein Maf [Clostridiales bacterium]|nr:septum formation protein Maf [Clostridiales bacterium]
MMKIILASGSPRRKELLEQAGYRFIIEVSDADENIQAEFPGTLVEELSHRKAGAVAAHYLRPAQNCQPAGAPAGGTAQTVASENVPSAAGETASNDVVTLIGADTVVVLDGKVLGKPDGEEGAVRMLRALSGRSHQVYTGVSLLLIRDGALTAEEKFHVCTDVTMREMTEEEIRRYVATGEPMDKAGAYGIQGKAAVFISGISGDYYNVVGLPICELTTRLRRLWKENGIDE